jgi:hypothetical protein
MYRTASMHLWGLWQNPCTGLLYPLFYSTVLDDLMLLSLKAAAGLHVVVELVGLGQVVIRRLNLVLLCSPRKFSQQLFFRIRVANLLLVRPRIRTLFSSFAFKNVIFSISKDNNKNRVTIVEESVNTVQVSFRKFKNIIFVNVSATEPFHECSWIQDIVINICQKSTNAPYWYQTKNTLLDPYRPNFHNFVHFFVGLPSSEYSDFGHSSGLGYRVCLKLKKIKNYQANSDWMCKTDQHGQVMFCSNNIKQAVTG